MSAIERLPQWKMSPIPRLHVLRFSLVKPLNFLGYPISLVLPQQNGGGFGHPEYRTVGPIAARLCLSARLTALSALLCRMAAARPGGDSENQLAEPGAASGQLKDRQGNVMAHTCSGFDPSLLSKPPEDRLFCTACQRIPRRPFQASCGHLYCQAFIQNVSGEQQCLAEGCEEKFSKEICFEDKAFGKEIYRLLCHCPCSTVCPWQGQLGQMDDHSSMCDYQPYQCPRCDEKLTLKEKPEHEQRCDKTPCRYKDVGCGAKVSKEKSRDHDRQAAAAHLDLLLQACDSLSRYGVISLELLSGDRDDGDLGEAASAAQRTLASEDRRLQEQLRDLLAKLGAEAVKSKEAADLIQGLVHNELPVVHEQKLRLLRRIEELSRLSHRADKDEQDLQERLRNLQLSTSNGTCLFKIERYHDQRLQAITGAQTRIYSPYFFTSPRGYKLRLVCYLNGDGSGKETHVSLFIIICRHRYDAILSWPFKYRVNLMCLNQEGGQPLKQSFTPDEGSSSFKRPDTDANVATGCPKFVELKKLAAPSAYVKDGTLLLKCVIDVPPEPD